MNHDPDRDDDLRTGARAAGYAEALADVRREIAAATWIVEGKHLVQVPDIIARINALEKQQTGGAT